MASDSMLRIEQPKKHVRLIVMQNPREMNKLSWPTVKQLRSELEKFEEDSAVRALILTGVDKVFCGGADLKLLSKQSVNEARQYLGEIIRLFNYLDEIEKPTIAAINGFAYGGGMEMSLACDFRLMSRSASMALPETKLGILPGAGGMQRLTHLIGRSKALEITLLGDPITPQQAIDMGLVFEICTPRKLVSRTVSLAESLAQLSGIALGHVKRLVRIADHATPAALDTASLDAMVDCVSTPALKDGLTNFIKKVGIFSRAGKASRD